MKKLMFVLVLLALLATPMVAIAEGIDDPGGIPLYVIIEVTWDGDPTHDGSWTVYGPPFGPPNVNGPILASCPIGPVESCLEMNYEFTFHGNTVHFDEIYVPTVDATPQVHHVVLHDLDGDGTYTGSLSAAHYFPWGPESDGSWAVLYFDRIEYDITFDGDGNVTDFHYLQYEHKKLE
jgi:hypothetical protein